jgi:hypothetical protein
MTQIGQNDPLAPARCVGGVESLLELIGREPPGCPVLAEDAGDALAVGV